MVVRSSVVSILVMTCIAACGENPPPRTLGSKLSLDSPPELAFKTGFNGDENIWLRLSDGQLRRVTDWEPDVRYAACPRGFSTSGYPEGAGRFSPLHFEPRSRRLLFAELLACEASGFKARLLQFELDSGVTRVVLDDLPELPALAAGAGIVIVQFARAGAEPGVQSFPAGIFELVEGTLKPLLPRVDNRMSFGQDAGELLEWGDRVLLLVDGAPVLEHQNGLWGFSTALRDLGSTRRRLSVSPSRTRLCATTAGQGWVFDANAGWPETVATEASSCHWSASSDRVAFGSDIFDVAVEQELAPVTGDRTDLATFSPVGTWRDQLVGTLDGGVVGLDWTTLELTTLLPDERAPRLCGGPASDRWLVLAPDDRPYAILRESCGCIDCDVSGSLLLQLDPVTTQLIEMPRGGHEINDLAWMPDGSAVVMSAQTLGMDMYEPAAGSHFAISAQGTVMLNAPPAGVTGVLHDPVVLR